MSTHPTFARAALGGLVGTMAMSVMMYVVAPRMLGLNMDIAAMLGTLVGGSWAAGLMIHFVNGAVIFPAFYVFVLFAPLSGLPRSARGVILGVALWLVAQTLVLPMMGAGLFSSNMGGMKAAMASLMSHVIYGLLLGIISGAGTSQPRVAHA